MKNFLLIVEGEKTEKIIIKEVLQKLDVNVIDSGTMPINLDKCNFDFDLLKLNNKSNNIIIIQGPRNRIHDLLKIFKETSFSLENWILKTNEIFAGIFWIYDVDHTSIKELKDMFNSHKDETTTGMLLVSSPCIEVIADIKRTKQLKCNHLKEYKKQLNKRFQNEIKQNTVQYIIENFFDLATYYIKRNYEDSKLNNIMEHPEFVINKINRYNLRQNDQKNNISSVIYNYFTTVVYCAIAYMFGLTKEINNYDNVLSFFQENSKK